MPCAWTHAQGFAVHDQLGQLIERKICKPAPASLNKCNPEEHQPSGIPSELTITSSNVEDSTSAGQVKTLKRSLYRLWRIAWTTSFVSIDLHYRALRFTSGRSLFDDVAAYNPTQRRRIPDR